MQSSYGYHKSSQKSTKANDLTSFSSTSFSSPVFNLPVSQFENKKQCLPTTHSPNLRSLYEYDIPSTMMISNNILHTDQYETQRKQGAMNHPFLHRYNLNTNTNTNEVETDPVLSLSSSSEAAVLRGMSYNNDTKDETAMVLNKRVKTRKREDFYSINNNGDAPVNKLQRRNEFLRNDDKALLLEPNNILHTDQYESQRKQEAITHPFLHRYNLDNITNEVETEPEPVLSSPSEAALSLPIDNSAVLRGMSYNNDTKDEAAMVLNKRVKTRKRDMNLDFSSTNNNGDAPVDKLQRRNEFLRNDEKAMLFEPNTTKQKARNTADSTSPSLSSKKTMSSQNIHSNNSVEAIQKIRAHDKISIPALPPVFHPLYNTNRIHSVNFRQTEIRKTPAPVLRIHSVHTFSTKTHSAGSINRIHPVHPFSTKPHSAGSINRIHSAHPFSSETHSAGPFNRIHSVHPFPSETQNNNTTTCNVPNSNNASSDKNKEKSNHVDTNLKALATLDSRTRTNYLSLVSFKEKYGNCNVPYRFSGNPILGQWVSNQRYQYDLFLKKDKRSTISLELRQLLDRLGFEWNAGNAVWDENFLEVKRALKRERNSTDSDIEIFNKWLTEQSNEFILFHQGRESKLTAIQAEKLASIGLGYLITDEK